MIICGLNKTTLLDYPGLVAATLFTGGCNFRCGFCHNKDLVLLDPNPFTYGEKEIYDFLYKRRNVLSGVCITGGEPTIHKDLSSFLVPIKKMGYQIKLDTNGSAPKVIQDLYENKLIDFIAMDIKTSPENYEKVTGISCPPIDAVQESISYVESCGIQYEFRTTVVKELHKREDFISIGRLLASKSPYFLQGYEENENVISPGFTSYSKEELEDFRNLLLPFLPNTKIRGF